MQSFQITIDDDHTISAKRLCRAVSSSKPGEARRLRFLSS